MLGKDSDLSFPHLNVLKASAGSGKTHALAQRFVQFLLSSSIPHNRLDNLLAITFSNNAAKEMKERILEFLKKISLGDEQTLSDFSGTISLSRQELRKKADDVLEDIFSNYSDFQVKTIDSFMTTVFKASAIELGYGADFDILLTNDSLMQYAFNLFLRRVREGTRESTFMKEIIDIIQESRGGQSPYLWEPAGQILREIEEIYGKLASTGRQASKGDYRSAMDELKKEIMAAAGELEHTLTGTALVRSRNSSFPSIVSAVRANRFSDLIGKGMKNLPVCKYRRPEDQAAYEAVVQKWTTLGELITAFTRVFACSYYTPYIDAYEAFSVVLESVKRHEGKIFIEDVNSGLAAYLKGEVVPDVYFRLGEVIFHYLIDEFQDTSPIQWHNLFSLLENSLSQQGSLFVVGDTKQAIYGFRDADYTIMRGIETVNPFPSAAHSVDELYVNYRSTGAITDFTRKVFQQRLCDIEEYSRAARETGLSDYRQTVKRGRENEGYVETWLLERNENEPPEKEKINEVIDSVLARGYSYSDIAILTSKNDDVVRVTTWLNEKQIPFLSYSSLDIRRRKITGEILALLAFLDSPPDDLCFATFILGDIFRACCTGRDRTMEIEGLRTLCFKNRRRRDRPLYKAFQEEMGELWEQYFGTLFRLSGYLPLYDLIVEAYKTFEVFRLFGPGEEAALTRILEVVKDLEAKGGSSLRRFLDAAGVPQDDEVDWNIDAPSGIAAVKVMTIHKAKGLGFPVVVLLLYGEKNRGFRYIIQQDGDSAALLRLTKPMLHVCNDFAVRYAEEEMRERVNQINTLYVALTRASAELHVVGVRGEKEFFPFALFPSGRSGVPSESIECREKVSGRAAAYYHTTPLIGSSAGEGALRFKEKQRGDLAHKILSFIIFNDAGFEKELDEISQEVCGKAGEGDQAYDLADMLYNFLRSDPARRYFERRPGRTVLVEQEFADAGGRLFRMDRVVLDSDRVTVLEYKTGGEGGEEEKHFAQMGNYLAILGQVFPGKDMEGLICYLDFGTVRHLYSGG